LPAKLFKLTNFRFEKLSFVCTLLVMRFQFNVILDVTAPQILLTVNF